MPVYLVFCLALLMHPVHETVTEVQWNSQTHRMEVAVRLDAEDERWIRAKVGPDAKDDETEKWAIPYLRSRLRVADLPDLKAKPPVKDSTRYHWVGRDRDGAHVWWYFEIEPSDAKRPGWIDNRLLFDREPDFLHRLLILDHTPPRATNLTLNRSKVTLQDAPGDAATPDPPKPLDTTDDDHAPSPPTDL